MTLDEVVIDILRDRALDDTDNRAKLIRMADWITEYPDDFWSDFGELWLDEIERVALMTDRGEE